MLMYPDKSDRGLRAVVRVSSRKVIIEVNGIKARWDAETCEAVAAIFD